jgi:hypothetical protein
VFGLKLKTQNTPLRVWAGRSCWEIRWSCFNRMTEFLIFTAHSIGVFHLSCTYILNIKSCSILFLKFHCVHLFAKETCLLCFQRVQLCATTCQSLSQDLIHGQSFLLSSKQGPCSWAVLRNLQPFCSQEGPFWKCQPQPWQWIYNLGVEALPHPPHS